MGIFSPLRYFTTFILSRSKAKIYFHFTVLLPFSLLILAQAKMFRSTPAFTVRVVSYNVLSSHLASPSHFSTLDPIHLESSKRLPLILKKLDNEINDSKSSVIVCLQEVSNDWAGAFHTWFSNRGYHLVTGLYGNKFNGYMGVAIAYPIETFETIDVDISRLSDKRIGGWPVEPVKSRTEYFMESVASYVKAPFKMFGLLQKPKEDHWSMSKRRFNILLTTTLKDKESGKSFCLGNYHMPCAYYNPMAMSLHAEMAAKHVQEVSSSNGDIPYVLAGDWNITPDSPQYRMMTTGKLDREDPAFPTQKYGMEWSITSEPMRSAYAEKDGEPNFTNFARVKEQDPFIDTLDYIFLSSEWEVVGTKSIVHRDIANGPFPNALEPSDHVLIAADLKLK